MSEAMSILLLEEPHVAEPMTEVELTADERALTHEFRPSAERAKEIALRLLTEVRRLQADRDDWKARFAQFDNKDQIIMDQAVELADIRARLAVYEPEVKDETPVCFRCGYPTSDGRCWLCEEWGPQTKMVPRWRYLAAQAILDEGDVVKP